MALSHPHARLNLMTVKCCWPSSGERKYPVLLAMVFAGILNLITRRLLRLFFSRALFYDARNLPPYFSMNGFPRDQVRLTRENLRQAVMASGSMPVLMQGLRDIPGAPGGMYRDAGILDYHLDIPYNSDSIVLYPHYMDRIITGWFDKFLSWRRPKAATSTTWCFSVPAGTSWKGSPAAGYPHGTISRSSGRRTTSA
jgi:hypothetical protein